MRFLLFIYSEPQLFQPTVNAANILAEKGHTVFLVGYKMMIPGSIKVNSNVNQIYFGNLKTGLSGPFQYLMAYFKLLKIAFIHKIDWIISYDAYATGISLFTASFLKIKWVYYQHDYWERPNGLWQELIYKIEKFSAGKAQILCFPQYDRANLFQLKIKKNRKIVIVHNGPRTSWLNSVKESKMHPIIEEIKKKYNNILIYQGGWSHYFGLENIIEAIPYSKSNFAVLFIGREHEPGIKESYFQLSQKLGISERLYFTENYIHYDEIATITKNCDIGFAILTQEENQSIPLNNRYLAGASNKLGEYIACGLPIITADTPSNRRFFEKYGTALFCDPKNPESIANIIDSILSDNGTKVKMSIHNKSIFNNELNFDKQFQKLIERIKDEAS